MSENAEAGGKGARQCPICGKPAADRFTPFCSARCRQIDLHRWLGEVYVVPGDEGPANEDVDETGADGEDGKGDGKGGDKG